MSDAPFHLTRMGQRYYEHTVPELVRELERLNKNLERLIDAQHLTENHDEEEPHETES